MARVAGLLREWAEARGESPREVLRWVAAGHLHDALKDAPEGELRAILGEEGLAAPPTLLHGPAAAARLRHDGVRDEELLEALSYHTPGHPGLADLGLALYVADYLEPGRKERGRWRAGLRDRMPGELSSVAGEVAAARIGLLLKEGRPMPVETFRFWNRIV